MYLKCLDEEELIFFDFKYIFDVQLSFVQQR